MDEKELKAAEEPGDGRVAGVILIIIGAVALAAQFIDVDWAGLLVMPLLALIFLVWGVLTRQSGLFIPGGVLAGIGLGTLLVAGPFDDVGGTANGGVFMLAFAAGWVLIPIFSIIFTDERHLWALIPAAIMGLIGAGLLFGGIAFQILELLGRIWPAFLILAGVYLLWRQSQRGAVEK